MQATKPTKIDIIRSRPNLFLKSKGHSAVAHLIDDLLRLSFCHGSPNQVEIEVTTDGGLRFSRDTPHPTGQGMLPSLVSSHNLAECFLDMATSSDTKAWATPLKPLAIAIALSSEASLVWRGLRQSFRNGHPVSKVKSAPKSSQPLELEALLDPEIFDAQIDAFPFKSRIQELATLFSPSIKLNYQYMGFPPVHFDAKSGLNDLLDFVAPDTKNGTPTLSYQDPEVPNGRLDVRLRLNTAPMERIKTFHNYVEVFNSPYEQVIRQMAQLNELIPRRQELDDLVASKLSYFGVYTARNPLAPDKVYSMKVETAAGISAVISSHGAEPDKATLNRFARAVDNWILNNPPVVLTDKVQFEREPTDADLLRLEGL